MKHSEPLKFDIERYFAGELDKKDASVLESHLEQCQSCNSYLQILRRERNEFLADHPFSSAKFVQREVSVKILFDRLCNVLLKPSLVPVYSMLLLVAVLVPVLMVQNNKKISDDIRFKGKAALSFVYKRDGIICEGDLNGVYRANDQVQIRYNSSHEQFVTLLSVDSKGVISFYHPDQKSSLCSIKSDVGSDLTFPGSIVFDDSQGAELIIMLYSDTPLETKFVEQKISELYRQYTDLSMLDKKISQKKIKAVTQISTLLLKKE